TIYHTPYTIYHIPYTIHHIPYTIYHIPYTIYHTPYIIYHILYTIYHIPYTIHHLPYTIHHIPYTIHHTPYIIYHIPYTIHHIPYTIQVIWGKDPKYLSDSAPLLAALASLVPLVSTAPSGPLNHRNLTYLGPQSPAQWRSLLGRSAFLFSLGHPLLGPSAIEAVSMGCVYVNTVYREALTLDPDTHLTYLSQHPYLGGIKSEFVCEYVQGDQQGARRCVQQAREVMARYPDTQTSGFLPPDYTYERYSERVRTIFRIQPE
ncbi:hypothetical protein EON63_11075, partial [archaeon]